MMPSIATTTNDAILQTTIHPNTVAIQKSPLISSYVNWCNSLFKPTKTKFRFVQINLILI